MVESKFIAELPEHKSDINYFGLNSIAEKALLGYCDKFYELLKETEHGNTSSVKLWPCGLEHSALGKRKKVTTSEIEQYLKLTLRHVWFSIRILSQLYLKLSRVNATCSTFPNAITGSPPTVFTNPQSESSITSLLFPQRVSLIF